MPGNNYFQFKQFRINQERSAMKVGMDGVLIGAWTDASNAKQILDVGTGTGLIALMMAQKNNLALVDAIEIDQDAFNEAELNVKNSPWNSRSTPPPACATSSSQCSRCWRVYRRLCSATSR
jgi:tRNA1Val (adenine37-N6)-methyltransferase